MLLTVLLFCSDFDGYHSISQLSQRTLFEDISLDNIFDCLKEISIFGKI